jgi:hypothetical protein
MAARTVTADGPVARERLTRETARDGLSRLAVGSSVGLLAGALIGGVVGRLAMLLLRVTSDSSLIGMTTDDGFRTGSFTTDTFFLVAITAIGGAGLGAAYVAVRRWLPRGYRPAVAAVVLGAIGGAAIIDPEGLDFTVLDPLWLAVAMFIALPAAFGAALASGVERLIPWASDRGPSTFVLLVSLLPIVLFPVMAVLVGLVALAWAALRRWPAAGRLWWSAPVTVAGRAVGIGATVLAAIVLAQDVAEIL